MRRSFVWLLGLTPTLAFGHPAAPMQWSADGRWVAYTVSSQPDRPLLPPGWIFETSLRARAREVEAPEVGLDGSRRFRIYAADAESGAAVLLHQSNGPLTSPAWSPDGRALVFGRVVDGGPGPARFEVVIQDAPGRDRILLARPLLAKPADMAGMPDLVPTWSPDGNYVAVPDVNGLSTWRIVRADDGQVLKSIEGVSSPVWSPDGTKLAFVRPDRTSSLLMMEVSFGRATKPSSPRGTELVFGPARHLVDLGQTFQTPVWSRDSKSILAIARRVIVRGRGPTIQVDLVRVPVDSGAVEMVANLSTDPADQDKAFHGVCFSIDREGDELFHATDADSQPSAVVWFRPKTQETVDRFPTLDISVRIKSISLSPNGKTLAIRFASPGGGSAAAFWDIEARRLSPIAPDDPSRQEWTSLLISTAKRLLLAALPPAGVAGRAVERPTVLPVPGELPSNHEVILRLKRIGVLGRPLCGPSAGDPARDDPTLETFQTESRLLFDVLCEDYPAAMTSLEALEARTPSPESRVRLLAVRAQICMGLKEFERASDVIEYLRSLEGLSASRYEVTPAGTTLTPEPVATNGWARYLAARLEDLTRSQVGKGDDQSPGHRNPDAPLPPPLRGLPVDRLPNGVFIAPRPGPVVPRRFGNAPPERPIRFFPPRPMPVPPPVPVAPRRP